MPGPFSKRPPGDAYTPNEAVYEPRVRAYTCSSLGDSGDQTKFRATGTGDDPSQRIAAALTDTQATEPLIARYRSAGITPAFPFHVAVG